MNTFFWEFEPNFKMPSISDVFPGEYFTIRRRKISFDMFPNEFHEQLESVDLKVTSIEAHYAPANVDFQNKKYGFLANGSEFHPSSALIFVLRGAETSKMVWWNKPEPDNVWINNPGKRHEKSWIARDPSIQQKRISASFETALVNTESFTSVETTSEPRIWLKLNFYNTRLKQAISFSESKNLLQRIF